jgi:hypothetical protein
MLTKSKNHKNNLVSIPSVSKLRKHHHYQAQSSQSTTIINLWNPFHTNAATSSVFISSGMFARAFCNELSTRAMVVVETRNVNTVQMQEKSRERLA